MKLFGRLLLTVTLLTGFVIAAESPIAGTWQGKFNDLPLITLSVSDNGGKLSGTVTFYRVIDDGSGPKAEARTPAPLINPKLNGKTFSFQVKEDSGSLTDYQMEITGQNEAKFKINITRADSSEAPEIKLIRQR